MNKNIVIGVIIIILLVAGVWYYQNNKSVPVIGLPAGEAGESIKIGVLMPLTGPRADGGEYAKNALSIAQEEINSNYSRRYKVDLVFEDSQYDPKIAVGGINKLINLNKVGFIIGPNGSSEAMAVAPIAEKNKVIIITPAAQSDDISQAGDYVFRMIHNTAQEAPIFADFVAKRVKSDTLSFLALNTAITDPYIKNFRPNFEQTGKKIGLIEKFDAKAVDFRAGLLKIKNTKPTDVFLIATPKQAGIILKQAEELGLDAQFYNIAVEGQELIAMAGNAANGLIYPYSYDNQSIDSNIHRFYKEYKTRHGKEPDTIAANSYDALNLLSNCFEKVGIEVDSVKNCLYSIKDYHGAGGTFSIDQNGDAVKEIIIKIVKDSKFVKLEE